MTGVVSSNATNATNQLNVAHYNCNLEVESSEVEGVNSMLKILREALATNLVSQYLGKLPIPPSIVTDMMTLIGQLPVHITKTAWTKAADCVYGGQKPEVWSNAQIQQVANVIMETVRNPACKDRSTRFSTDGVFQDFFVKTESGQLILELYKSYAEQNGHEHVLELSNDGDKLVTASRRFMEVVYRYHVRTACKHWNVVAEPSQRLSQNAGLVSKIYSWLPWLP